MRVYQLINLLICTLLLFSTVAAAGTTWMATSGGKYSFDSNDGVETKTSSTDRYARSGFTSINDVSIITVEDSTPAQEDEPASAPASRSNGDEASVVVFGTESGALYAYEKTHLDDTGRLWQKINAHSNNVWDLEIDGDLVYSASSDGYVKAWDKHDGTLVYSVNTNRYAHSIEVTDDAVYVGDNLGYVKKYSKDLTGTPTQFDVFADQNWDDVFDLWEDGNYVYATGGYGQTVKLNKALTSVTDVYDYSDLENSDASMAYAVAVDDNVFTGFSGFTIAGVEYGKYNGWIASSATQSFNAHDNDNDHNEADDGSKDIIFDLDVDENYLYSVGSDGKVKKWAQSNNALDATMTHCNTCRVFSVEVDDNGLWTGGSNGAVKYWDKDGNLQKSIAGFNGVSRIAADYNTIEVNYPPVADIHASKTVAQEYILITFTADTNDPDGNDVEMTHEWNFDDGNTDTGEIVHHSYENADTYTVTLTVTDEAGASTNATKTILITEGAPSNTAPVVDTLTTSMSSIDRTVSAKIFCDGSDAEDAKSLLTASIEYKHADDSDWIAFSTSYSASRQDFKATFNPNNNFDLGDYDFRCKLDDGNLESNWFVENALVNIVNLFPEAVITGGDLYIDVGEEVSFDGTGSYDPDGTITEYRWKFGDAMEDAYGATADHTYTYEGNFVAELRVTDNDGGFEYDTVEVQVDEAPFPILTAFMTVSPEEADTGVEFTFDATDSECEMNKGSGTCEIDVYEINFGDEEITYNMLTGRPIETGRDNGRPDELDPREPWDPFNPSKPGIEDVIDGGYGIPEKRTEPIQETFTLENTGIPSTGMLGTAGFTNMGSTEVGKVSDDIEQVSDDIELDQGCGPHNGPFGRGCRDESGDPIITHAYDTPGIYTATLIVKTTHNSVEYESNPYDVQVTVSDNVPPVITNVRVEDITGYGATVKWDTDEQANSLVYYDDTINFDSEADLNSYVNQHGIVLTNLYNQTTYNYKVVSTDHYGNTAESGYFNFTTADITPPAIVIDIPAEGAFFGTQVFNATWHSDAMDVTNYYVSIDGTSNVSMGTLAIYERTYSEGLHTITVYGCDAMSNCGYDEHEFTIDLTAPVITITYPTDGSNVSTSTINATWTSVDANPGSFSVSVNSAANTSRSVPYYEAQYTDATHMFTVYSCDLAGNCAFDGVNFTVDTVVPNITINTPVDGTFFTQNSVNVAWNTTVDNIENFYVSVNTTTNTTTTNESYYTTYPEGDFDVDVYVCDFAGNCGVDTVSFTVDSTEPVFGAGGVTATSSTISLGWSANERVNATVDFVETATQIGGVSFYGYATNFNEIMTRLKDSTSYDYKITIYDVAGNGPVSMNGTLYTLANSTYIFTDVHAENPTPSTVDINFTTNEPTYNYEIVYWRTPTTNYTAYGNNIQDMWTSTMQLQGLQSDSLYYYTVKAVNWNSVEIWSAVNGFTTGSGNCTSHIVNSTIDGVYYSNTFTDLAGNTTVNFCSTIVDSTITASTITNSTVTRSTVLDSILVGMVVTDAYIDPTDAHYSTLDDSSTVIDSSIWYSTITNYSSLNNSYTEDSTINNSTLDMCTVMRSTVFASHGYNCTIIDSDVSGLKIWDGWIVNDTLVNGTVEYDGFNYTAPPEIPLDDIRNDTPPVAVAKADESTGYAMVALGDPVAFNGSDSTDNIGIVSYSWAFDDSSSGGGPNPETTHTYTATGLYTVSLTVTDLKGQQDTDYVTVAVYNASALLADLAVSADLMTPTTVESNVPFTMNVSVFNLGGVDANDSSYTFYTDGANPTEYKYVDVPVATAVTVQNDFTLSTTSVITIVVDNESNIPELDEMTNNNASVTVTATQNFAPTVLFTMSTSSLPAEGGMVSFDASASFDPDGTITNYYWVYGDGNNESKAENTALHLYGAANTQRTVTLTVTDNQGATNSTSMTLTIGNGGSNNDQNQNNDGGNNRNSGGSGWTVVPYVEPPETGTPGQTEELAVIAIDDIVTYEIGQFLVTRDYVYNPNSDYTKYTMHIVNRGEEMEVNMKEFIPKNFASTLAGFEVTPDPSVFDVPGNALVWTRTIGEGESFEVVYQFDKELSQEDVKALLPPQLSTPVLVPGIGEVEVIIEPEVEEAPSPVTGFFTFAQENFWGGLIALLVIALMSVLAAAGWRFLQEQGAMITIGQGVASPEMDEPAGYERGTLY